MDLKETLLTRRSIRKYTQELVTQEQIDFLLHAAMSGPSACNRTPWEFYVITNPEMLEQLRSASRFSKITAPLAIVVCGNLSRSLPLQLSDYWIQDCSAATENILLAATSLGLGSLWCGIYPQKRAEEKIRQILDLPKKHIPLNIIYIGHSDQKSEPRDQYNEKYIHVID